MLCVDAAKIFSLLIIITVTLFYKDVHCECRNSYVTLCDSIEDIRNGIHPRWTDLIIGKENVRANNLTSYNLHSLIPMTNVTSLTILGQLNELRQLFGTCDFVSSLEILHFYNNDLKILKTNTIPKLKLKKLSLANNNIEYVEPLFIDSDNKIDTIDLSDNKLEAIEQGVFVYFGKLIVTKTLILRNNRLSHIQIGSLPETLKSLNLDGNNLRLIQDEALANLHDLQELILSRNHLYDIPNISNLTKLGVIDFSYNSITKIDNKLFRNFTELYFINLSSNKIYQATLSDFSFLARKDRPLFVALGFNLLSDFKFDNVTDRSSLGAMHFFLYGNPFACNAFNEIQKSMIELKIRQSSCDVKFQSEGKTPYCLDYNIIFYKDVPKVKRDFLAMIENNKKLISCELNPETYIAIYPFTCKA
jgi:hypothetical protein